MGARRSRGPRPGGAEPGLPGGAEPGRGDAHSGGPPPRRRHSREERSRLIAAWRETEETQQAFCSRLGITLGTFKGWIRVERRAADGAAASREGQSGRRSRRPHRIYTPEERRAAVEAFQKTSLPIKDFCLTWGVSMASLRDWLARYEKDGPKGLEPRTRKPSKADDRRRLPEVVKAAIVAAKKSHPDFGLRKVRDALRRFLGIKVSVGSVQKTLREAGFPPLAKPRRKPRHKKKPPRRFERARPGELWQSDITSFVLARPSRRVYLVVFLDDHSRYIVSWGLYLHQKQDIVVEAYLAGVTRFGKPREVLTDQGRQYFAWRGKSAFQKLLQKEGVDHVVSRPHHPQTLGKCERLWATVAREFWERAEPRDLEEARERLRHFLDHYNHFRPHQGIDGLVPADRFFGAEDATRKTLEEQLARNALDLAIARPPRKPVYLFGQIGDRRVSLHGERGRLVVQTPDGGRQELELEHLGAPEERPLGEHASQEEDDARRGVDSGDTPSNRPGEAQAQAAGQEARVLQGAEEDARAGARAVGACGSGRPGAGPPDLRDHPGVLAGPHQQAGGHGAAGASRTASVAAQPAGALRYAGGPRDPASQPQETGLGSGRPGRGSQAPEEEGQEAGTGAGAGQAAHRRAARASGQSGSGAAEEAETHGREREGQLGHVVATGRAGGEKKADASATPWWSARRWLAGFGRNPSHGVADDASRSGSP